MVNRLTRPRAPCPTWHPPPGDCNKSTSAAHLLPCVGTGGTGGTADTGPDCPISTSWLVCDGVRVAPVTVAATSLERSHGLVGRDRTEEALLLRPAFVVHTFGMRFPIDVAFCDRRLRVRSVVTMARNRVNRPRVGTSVIVEAQAGAFIRWRLKPGSHLGVEGDGDRD